MSWPRAEPLAVAAASPGAVRAGETEIGGLFTLLRRDLGRILLSVVAGLLLALVYLAVATPTYTASTSIFVDPRYRKMVGDDVVQGGVGVDLALIETQLSILRSDSVLGRVVDRLGLDKDEEFVPPQGTGMVATVRKALLGERPRLDPRVEAMEALARSVRIKRAQKTYVIDIDVQSRSPVRAAAVAAAMTSAYLADQTGVKVDEAARANVLIDARLAELRLAVRRAEDKIDDFKRSNRIVTSEGGFVGEQQLTRLTTELATARGVVAETRARLAQLETSMRAGGSADSLTEAIRSNVIQRLREQHAAVARREAALASQLQSRHPALIEVRSQLAEIRSQITAELRRIVRATRSESEVAANRLRELEGDIDRAKGEVTRSQTAQIQLRELERERDSSRSLLGVFLARAKETAQQQKLATPEARVISPPSIPVKPSRPIGWLVLGLGALAGMTLGTLRALVADHVDTTRADVAAVARPAARPQPEAPVDETRTFRGRVRPRRRVGSRIAPTLDPPSVAARLPAIEPAPLVRRTLRRLGTRGGAAGDVTMLDVMTAVGPEPRPSDEPFRRATDALLRRLASVRKAAETNVVMITSVRSRAGVSSIALALAYAAALAGRRTLLVDAAMRDADLSMTFARDLLQERPCVLDDPSHLAALIAVDAASGLRLLPAAFMNLDELADEQRARFTRGLELLARDYDLVVVDAGALTEDPGTAELAGIARQALLVTRDEIAEHEALRAGHHRMARAGARATAIIQNAAAA